MGAERDVEPLEVLLRTLLAKVVVAAIDSIAAFQFASSSSLLLLLLAGPPITAESKSPGAKTLHFSFFFVRGLCLDLEKPAQVGFTGL